MKYRYLFFDPVNLLREINTDVTAGRAEYMRVRKVALKRARDLIEAGYDVSPDVTQALPASELSLTEMALSLSKLMNFTSRKTSTVAGMHASDEARSKALKAKGYDVEPYEVQAFGTWWNTVFNTAVSKAKYRQSTRQDMWEEAKREVSKEKINQSWDEARAQYEKELKEAAERWKAERAARRSAAARKGWETRRRKQAERAKRSAAARKGWETRRRRAAEKAVQ